MNPNPFIVNALIVCQLILENGFLESERGRKVLRDFVNETLDLIPDSRKSPEFEQARMEITRARMGAGTIN